MSSFEVPNNDEQSRAELWKKHLEETENSGMTDSDIVRSFLDKIGADFPKPPEIMADTEHGTKNAREVANHIENKQDNIDDNKAIFSSSAEESIIKIKGILDNLDSSLKSVPMHYEIDQEVRAPLSDMDSQLINWKILHAEKGHYVLEQHERKDGPQFIVCAEQELNKWGN